MDKLKDLLKTLQMAVRDRWRLNAIMPIFNEIWAVIKELENPKVEVKDVEEKPKKRGRPKKT